MKKFLLIIAFFGALFTAHSQDVVMQNGTFTQCSGVFSDSGGVTSNYSDGENFVITFCPDSVDQFVQLEFTTFSTQLVADVMTIYDGDDTSGTILGTFSGGTTNPGTISAAPTSATGCITISFVSDAAANTNTTGWSANISCLQSCQTITPTIDTTNPIADTTGVVQVALGGSVSFDGSANFSDDNTGAIYSWNFGDGFTDLGESVAHTFNSLGLYTVTFTAMDTNPTGCSSSDSIQVQVLSPYIDVDQTTYTVPELVEDVLINSACASVSNINWSTGTNFGDVNGIGYFTAIPGAFAFEAGIVLNSGDAMEAEGPETGVQSSGGGSWPGDSDLEAAINTDLDGVAGDDLPAGFSTNASYIEFDFVPIANSISFDFLFASDEYGGFQCSFSDAFAFLLTDLTTTTTVNLALVPGTTDVVSVYTVRDNTFDPSCSSENPAYFDSFYGAGGQPAANSPIDFRGYTVAMTAFANVTPNNNYRIKLVVADDGGSGGNDTSYNSAVFLGAGTFNLGGDLGDDVTIGAGTAICSGGVIPLDTNLPTASHTWYLDGVVIPGETSSTLDAMEPGVYSVDVVFSATCQASDSVLIEFISGPTVQNTIDIVECDNATGPINFDLTVNDTEVIGAQTDVFVSYHTLLVDAQNDANPIVDPANYVGSGVYPETIYVRIEDLASQTCSDIDSFSLDVSTAVLNQAPDLEVCDDLSNDGVEFFDLESQTATILDAQLATDFNVTYHNSFADADADINPLTSPYSGSDGEFIFVRLERASDANCYSANQLPNGGFTLIVNANAVAIQPMDLTSCDDPTEDGFEVFDLTAQETTILGGQDPLNYTVTFYEDMADVITEANSILNPGAYQNTSASQQTIYVRVNDNSNSTCYGSTTFDLIVNPLPTVAIPTSLTICDDGTPDGLASFNLSLKNNEISGGNPAYAVSYYLTQAEADSGTNALAIPYDNISNPQIVFVRVMDVNTSCFTTTTLQLEVEQAPVTFEPTDLTFCDPDSDGYGVFMLTDAEAEITAGAPGLTVTYHETSSDALLNVNPVTSPYNNISENTQTIYVRVESATIATSCASFEELVLIVNPTPQITDPSPLEVCDTDADGLAQFDLELNNPEILNQLDADATNDLAATDYSITYYATAADAAVPQNAIATPNAYTNTTPNMDTVWVVIADNANGCSTITTMDLIVNPLPVLLQASPLVLCNDNDLPGEVPALAQEEFTLEDANAEILNGQTGITLTYYFTQAGADNATASDQIFSPYTNVANAQSVFVRAENDITGCVSTITFRLDVNPTPSPEANPTALLECDIDNDGFASFDLDSQTSSILNGEPDVSISYHETEADAISAINPLISPYTNIVATNQMVYVRAENDITGCFTIVVLPLEVQLSPVVPVTLDDYVVCDDNNDGFNQFDFDTVMTPQILGTQNPADFTLTYHTTALNAASGNSPIVNTGNYTNTTSGQQTIYIRLVSNANGCVTTGQFEIIVDFPPVLVQPTPLAICDELDVNYYENNDDMATFDLTLKDDEITAGNVSWTVAYYETQADAQADVNVIADPTLYTNMMVGTNPANPQTVYVRVTDSNTGCFSFTTLT
ncbi:choice-of-anchor L domain-containing protein, partial [Olleya namhaensis]|uniref:choice-of-anchor L domain-containing protein n=1 Tax=Olleya namhaensis TaxID=1144750 RepID=UPI002492466F